VASEWTPADWEQAGTVDVDEGPLEVWRRRDGVVSLDVPVNGDGAVFLDGPACGKFRELLDRCAMPSQVPPVTEAPAVGGQGDWAGDVAAWLADAPECTACGAALVRDPDLIGSWLAKDGEGATGVCPASDVKPYGHHKPKEDSRG
jgi:hypothetical protein